MSKQAEDTTGTIAEFIMMLVGRSKSSIHELANKYHKIFKSTEDPRTAKESSIREALQGLKNSMEKDYESELTADYAEKYIDSHGLQYVPIGGHTQHKAKPSEHHNAITLTVRNETLVQNNNMNPVSVEGALYIYVGGHLKILKQDVGHHKIHTAGGVGLPVDVAGEITIEQGKVTKINNNSGHYGKQDIQSVIEYLIYHKVLEEGKFTLCETKDQKGDLYHEYLLVAGDHSTGSDLHLAGDHSEESD